MLLTELRKANKLAQARVQPNLCFVPFSIQTTLAEIQARHFPEINADTEIHFVSEGSLACVHLIDTAPVIYLHQVLNHVDTPLEVVSHICKHELLHLRIRPGMESGKMRQHTKAFWEAEKSLSRERDKAWAWIWINLSTCLKSRPKLERVDVLPKWKDVWNRPKVSIELVETMVVSGLPPTPSENSAWCI